MATIINNPGENRTVESSGSSGGIGVIIGAVLVVLVLVVVLIYAVPYFRDRIDAMSQPVTPVINPTINVQIPAMPTIPTATTTK